MGAEGKPCKFGDLFCRALGEFRMRVQARAYRSPADGEIVKTIEGLLQALDVPLQQAGPAAEFLSESQGHGVLQMGATDLDDIAEFYGLGCNGIVHCLD